MPLHESDVDDVKRRLYLMFMDTIETFRVIERQADFVFGDRAPQVRLAIQEYLHDFIENPDGDERVHPEVLIFKADRIALQNAGFYDAQLALKERQVTEANLTLRERLMGKLRSAVRAPFGKWVDRVNNFLGSLAGATGMSEALKELKDCLRDELPDD